MTVLWRCLCCIWLLAAGVLSPAQTTAASRWISLGPEGGDARSLAYDPHDASRVFLGTSAGDLYLSTDAGARWSRFGHLGNGNDYVLDHIAIDPVDADIIFVAAWSIENKGGGIFRSRDAGRTWETLSGMAGKSVRSFAVFHRNPRVLVAGTLDGVFRSLNGGDTWKRISPANHPEIKNIESIAIDPRSPEVIYAGTWHLPWRTVNGGRAWNSMKRGIIDDSDVFSIIIDRWKPSTVYLSACSGIYKSNNAGELFRKAQGIPFSARRTRVLRQDPLHPAIIYAGTTEGLWKTLDAGKTWRRSAAHLIINDVLVDPRRPARVLLATDRGGVFSSDDAGLTFHASNHGFSHRQVSAVLADARDPATLYAGVINDKEFGGVFVTHDSGLHWRQMNAGLGNYDILALVQSAEGFLLAGTQRGIYRFDRKSARWRATDVVVSEETTTVVSRSRKTGKVSRTTQRRYLKSRLIARIAGLTVSGDGWFAATSAGVYSSHDHGQSWQRGPVAERDFISIDAYGEQVLASTAKSLLLSRDGGANWTRASIPASVDAIYAVALSPNALWITTRVGVFSSQDDGATWEHVLVGDPARNLTAVHYDRASRHLLAVTGNGEIYASADGRKWTRAADPGLPLRSVSYSGGRLLGITPFSGIVAQPEAEAQSLRVGTAGGSQP